jgi:hypothetical protein
MFGSRTMRTRDELALAKHRDPVRELVSLFEAEPRAAASYSAGGRYVRASAARMDSG